MRFSTLSLLCAILPVFTEAAVLGRREVDPATEYKYETAGLRESGQCRIYHEPWRDLETCSCLPGQGVACYSLNMGSDVMIIPLRTDYEGNQWEQGRCVCDPPELVFFGNLLMEILPLVGQATCMVAMEALKTITTVGLNAVPIGKGMSLGMRMVLKVTKQLSKKAAKDQKDGFSLWMSPCDGPDYMKEKIDNVWSDLVKSAVDGDPDNVQDDLSCEQSECPDVNEGNEMILRVEAKTARDIAQRKDRQFAPGWCGMHVTQYQKPDPSKDQYKFDVVVKDAEGNEIGNLKDAYAGSLQSPESIGVTSRLPYVLMVDAGNVDDDAVLFRYGAQSWGSNDQEHHCDFGSYDNGSRQGDCGFQC